PEPLFVRLRLPASIGLPSVSAQCCGPCETAYLSVDQWVGPELENFPTPFYGSAELQGGYPCELQVQALTHAPDATCGDYEVGYSDVGAQSVYALTDTGLDGQISTTAQGSAAAYFTYGPIATALWDISHPIYTYT